eukprot:COSAG02_NODE_46267_length_350_cov_0.828685_1_plen_72_part_01
MDTTTASVGSPGCTSISPCPARLSEYVFKVDESVASKGCVFRCINLWHSEECHASINVTMGMSWKYGCDNEN